MVEEALVLVDILKEVVTDLLPVSRILTPALIEALAIPYGLFAFIFESQQRNRELTYRYTSLPGVVAQCRTFGIAGVPTALLAGASK